MQNTIQRPFLIARLVLGFAVILLVLSFLAVQDVNNKKFPSTGIYDGTRNESYLLQSQVAVKPSWIVAQEQEDMRDVVRGKIDLLGDRVKEVMDAELHETVLNPKCHFVFPLNRHVTRFENLFARDYKPYMKRPEDFFNVLRDQLGKNQVVVTDFLPSVYRPPPIVLSPSFNISIPFGKWKTFFYPSPFSSNTIAKEGTKSVFKLSRNVNYHKVQLTPSTPSMYIAMFPNAVASSGHVITCSGNVYTAGGCLRQWYLPDIMRPTQLHWFSIVIPLCDEWCSGFFHFTHEHLLRVALVHKILLQRSDAVLLLNSPKRKFHKEWLVDVLGIPPSCILYETQPAHAHIILYPIPIPCGSPYTQLIFAMRSIVYEKLQLVAPPFLHQRSKRKLFFAFAERWERSRMPINYDALKMKLMEEYENVMSFTTIAKDYSVAEQVRAFFEADIVVGPHGANLANTLWMRRGTHLIEMLSYLDSNLCYYTAAASVGVTYQVLFHNSSKEGGYLLDYDYLKRHVDYAIQMLS